MCLCMKKTRTLIEQEEGSTSFGHSTSPQEHVLLLALLKDCTKEKNLSKGIEIHADIHRKGWLEKSIVLSNALITLYAKCGALLKAREVFDNLNVLDAVSWNALIAGYAQNGQGHEALHCFERMKVEGQSPDAVTFVCNLKACGSIGAINRGKECHASIAMEGFLENDVLIGNTLVSMYVKCGALMKAEEIFDELQLHNIISSNVMIGGYVKEGFHEKALNCFNQMVHDGVSLTAVTFVCVLKACCDVGAVTKVHAMIVRGGFLEKDVAVGNTLMDTYAKCGAIERAREVFDDLLVHDVVSWNALIAGYSQCGCGKKALNCFEQMQCIGYCPDTITLACALKACGSIGAIEEGRKIHGKILTEGMLTRGTLVGNALVDMYARCGELTKAQEVFDELLLQDVVSWNSLITGFTQHGRAEEALNCFEKMCSKGFYPNAVTYLCIVKACGSTGALQKGESIHDESARKGWVKKSVLLSTALVDMYARCGALEKAQNIFDDLQEHDVVSWTALISGYGQHGYGEEALSCYTGMLHEGISPNTVTLVAILKACGSIGAIDMGREVHAEIAQGGWLAKDILIGHALLDMYAKCGALEKAQEVFDELRALNAASWTMLIEVYAQSGHGDEALIYFNHMRQKGTSLDASTFVSVLSICSRLGLVEKGQSYFEMMSRFYDITPNSDHFICMIDLFGRSGHFDKAMAEISKMPFCDCLLVWSALSGACQKWGNVKLARLAFEHSVCLDKHDVVAYVTMRNIYKAAAMQEDMEKIEVMMEKIVARDKLGCEEATLGSLIE